MEREVMDIFQIVSEKPVIVLFLGMILVGVILVVVSFLLKMKANDRKQLKLKEVVVKDDDVKSKELGEIEKSIFELYKEIEIAKMKFRFEVLKEKLDEELYLNCERDLKELKKNHQKIVSTDIQLEGIRISSRYQRKNIEKMNVFLHVSQYDYVMNKEKNVVRGTDEDRYQIEYKLVVERDLISNRYVILKKECVGKWISK